MVKQIYYGTELQHIINYEKLVGNAHDPDFGISRAMAGGQPTRQEACERGRTKEFGF